MSFFRQGPPPPLGGGGGRRGPGQSHRDERGNPSPGNSQRQQQPITCHNCRETGHIARNCNKPYNVRTRNQNSVPNTSSDSHSRADGAGLPKLFENVISAGAGVSGNQQRNSRNSTAQNGRPTFGFTRLHCFLSDEPGSVIMSIGRNIPEWKELIDSLPTKSNDFIALIIHVLAEKVCQLDEILASNRVEIITNTLQDNFRNQLQKIFGSMLIGELPQNRGPQKMTIDQSRVGILRSVHTIFIFVAKRCPKLATDYVLQLVPGVFGMLTTMELTSPANELPTVRKLLVDFRQLLENIKVLAAKAKLDEPVVKRRFNNYELTPNEEAALHGMAPPDDFREIPITPTIEEILSMDEPFLRTNLRKGAYADGNHYLDVQFRLLREDFVNPLKKGIQDFKKHQDEYLSNRKKMPLGTVRIYPNITIKDVALIRDVTTYSIQLPKAQFGKIKWEKSKRLLNGSLLVFTSDNFKSAHFATVASREIPKLKDGILGVSWLGEIPDLNKSSLMVECEVYFEAYRHTLEILKKIPLDTFPLAKFIVQSSDIVDAPNYLEEITEMIKVGCRHISPLVLPWPSSRDLGLTFDDNQFQAFQAALTKEFSIIQGPPGTGKTYLGLRIAETFLRNVDAWRQGEEGPILVVCYTNHALDQFLEGIVSIMNSIDPNKDPELIRVGGRSKCESLDQFSLIQKRITASRLRAFPHGYAKSKYEAMAAVRDLEADRAALLAEAVGLGNLEGLVDFRSLACFSKLSQNVSVPVLTMLEDPNWLGFGDPAFRTSGFKPSDLVRTWFNTTTDNIPVRQERQPAVAVPTNGGGGGDHSMSEDEDEGDDYDLEELLANRLEERDVEEIKFEMSKQKSGGKITYLSSYSISECNHIVENAGGKLAVLNEATKKNTSAKEWADIQDKRRTFSAEVLHAENMGNLLELIMGMYNEERLRLPDMSHYLGKELDLTLFPLRRLSLPQKWSIYFGVIEKARVLAVEGTAGVKNDLVAAQKKLEEIKRYGDAILLRQTKVVGMTTTGAAKYNDFLQIMKSKIVIVEEAAEVLESHIVTCITSHCQQLILIDISLFERMLNNNLNCYRLKVQHRMRPEIADLVVGTIYKELENSPNVFDYPDVLGMDRNLFFFDHQELENSEADSMSKSNKFEAVFLAKLCRHLILQGYDPSEITVLTTYTGQMFLLKKEINDLTSCKGVRVTVVDNYQGEENKVILLSLVRSNEANNIGFLKTDNRICVAISRAKHGLYICGNMSNLTAKSATWTQIREKLTRRREIGKTLKLVCQIHGTITEVKVANDFTAHAPEGGCNKMCEATLKCTHICESVCHTTDQNHEEYQCMKKCLKFCDNAHPCKARCYHKCPPCNVRMEKTLPCQHTLSVLCPVDPATVECHQLVTKRKPCGHSDEFACFVDETKVTCRVKVPKKLACGHEKIAECHVEADQIQCRVQVPKTLPCTHVQTAECRILPEMISCETEVEKGFPDCIHKTIVKCKDKNNTSIYCRVPCSDRLDCGHQCTKICHPLSDPAHIMYECKKDCARQCENGHPCRPKHKCHLPCPPCKIDMEKTLSCRVHKSVVTCYIPVDSVECHDRCEKILPVCNHKCLKECCEECVPCQTLMMKRAICGHNVESKCSELPLRMRCKELVSPKELSPCFHDTKVPCRLKDILTAAEVMDYCKHPCGYRFELKEGQEKGCNHVCKGSCSECRQGRLHLKCQEECGRVLVCGHVCSAPCASDCPPCQQPCWMKCEHSACKNTCGTPCTDCKEKCSWNCIHKRCSKLCSEECDREPCDEPCEKKLKCGHPCVGFCGEPCPPLCRICNKEALTTEFILYGNEEDEDARFVYLEDCKHTIEAEGLTYYMSHDIEEGEIGAKTCPRCKTIIRQSKRFGNILRKRLVDVMVIKTKIFGDQEIAMLKQQSLIDEITTAGLPSLNEIVLGLKDYLLNKLIQQITNPFLTRQEKNKNAGPKFKFRKVPYATLQSLELIWALAKSVARVCQEAKEQALIRQQEFSLLNNQYGQLFRALMERSLPLTKTELENFGNEFERHYDICEVYKRRGCPRFTNGHSKATPVYERALELVQCLRPYSPHIKKRVHELLKGLDDLLRTGLGISEIERKQIVNAIRESGYETRQGRFFKCPNGHYYMIGNCGGAMEESTCPECGAIIGGGAHRVRGDNQFAPEVDGASQPLWPQ